MTRVLILGIGGQDGLYLTRLLRARGHDVVGIVRGEPAAARARLTALGVGDEVVLIPARGDGAALGASIADIAPGQIYDLRNADGPRVAALLAAARGLAPPPCVFIAGSGAMFGDSLPQPADETTTIAPTGPAAAAQAADFPVIAAARAGGLFAVTGILFGHASRLDRASRAAALVDAAWRVSTGAATEIALATPDASRDWGWAPEYVDAMTRMLGADTPRDYVVATGTALTDRQFAAHALAYFNLDPVRHLRVAEADAPTSLIGDPGAIARDLGWKAYTHGRDLVETLCEGVAAG